jgi:cell division transport system permease protein
MAVDAYEYEQDEAPPPPQASVPDGPLPRFETPIVPKATIAGRALVAVVAIMTFLGALTTGGVMLLRAAASDWQAAVSREVTIQVKPVPNRDIEPDIARAAAIAKGFPWVAEVRPYSREESARLLEPWLGTGLQIDDLPIPRLIVVRIAPGASPDFEQLRKALAAELPGASLDDHRAFVGRMRAMAGAAVVGGLIVLALMFAATVLSVTFATRGAMATNRPVVEVLHFIGAKDSFIAGNFQRHFLVLGLKGGAIGGGAAILLFGLAEVLGWWLRGTASGDQIVAMFGTFSIGVAGYVAVLVLIAAVAAVTALTSRHTVNRTLQTMQ